MTATVLFYDPDFPYEGSRPDSSALASLQGAFKIADAAGLADALEGAEAYIHLHGPYFPKAAWTAILRHAREGKGIVAVGGAPYRVPVGAGPDGGWRAEPEQTAYHRQLYIHEALKVASAPIVRLRPNADLPLIDDASLFTIEEASGLVLHPTRSKDRPGDHGSSGPMDARIYPLLAGVGGSPERELSAPAVLLEHSRGEYAGGRWALITQRLREAFWAKGGSDLLVRMGAYTAAGVTEMTLGPLQAVCDPGDRPQLALKLQRIAAPGAPVPEEQGWTASLAVRKAKTSRAEEPDTGFDARSDDERFETIWRDERQVRAGREQRETRLRLPIPAEPGFYTVECVLTRDDGGESRTLRQGFWGMDEELLREGRRLVCGRDYFEKDGKPFPIVGMTYMTSDVARKYLFLPNAAIWDHDMARMKRAGINFIRTGIWTAWRHYMYVDGHAQEEALRAIDAFLLTAKRHGIEVCFNFFSFTPEEWEGVNPYLDPRSVEAQKRFIAAVVSRHAETKHVHWDLINEPSLFDPKRLFEGPRPAGDRFEREAYVRWLRERHGGDIALLQERWNRTPAQLPSFEAAVPPGPEDVPQRTTPADERPSGPWLDYALFSMEMLNRWARALVETIRAIQPEQLVTVGQDEAIKAQRPSPHFYAEAVDYTTVHSWWNMDDLVWDSVFAKDSFKPCLVQETGIMYVETADGRAKRGENELRDILERKYAYAFATGGAGAVQWIWNVNYHMDDVNECHIGALRADGTEKPEAEVSYSFGAFIGAAAHLFQGRRLEEVAVVYPYSDGLSARPLAPEATARAVRTLTYRHNMPLRGFGEYQLDGLAAAPPKLIVVPSAHGLSDGAAERLLDHTSRRGGVLLLTGPIGLDDYGRPCDRLRRLLGAGALANLLREERIRIGDEVYEASFPGDRITDSFKQRLAAPDAAGIEAVIEAPCGAGTVLWCPLPLELSDDKAALDALYRLALRRSGAEPDLEWLAGGELAGIYGRKLAFAEGAVYVFVSESGAPAELAVRDPDSGAAYAFRLESGRAVLFAADAEGRLVAVCRPDEVHISVTEAARRGA